MACEYELCVGGGGGGGRGIHMMITSVYRKPHYGSHTMEATHALLLFVLPIHGLDYTVNICSDIIFKVMYIDTLGQ